MADEKKNAKKKYQRAERRYRRIAKSTTDSLQPEELYPLTHLDNLKKELDDAHKDVELQAETYRELLDSDDDADKPAVDETDKLLEELQQDFSQVATRIAKLSLKTKNEAESQQAAKKSESNTKLQRFDPPKFNGETRAFPAFITHYKKHVETQYGKDPFILMKCLSGEAEKHVRPVEEDYDEMMDRLHTKYGSSEKQVDVILKDLKGLKRVSDGDLKALHKLIETVENCWLDLKRMNLEAEMDTTSMLSTIEKLLPEVQKREWTLQKPSSSKFSDLLGFLTKEKTAIEYMSDDLRSERNSQKGKVNLSEIEEVVSEESEKRKDENEDTKLVINLFEKQMESQRQFMELVANAITRDKPTNPSAPPQPSYPSFSTFRCWIHKSGGHNITECNTFITMQTAEKVDAVKKNRACFYCLQVGHGARQCLNKKPCGQVTGGNSCKGSHHQLLHAAHVEGLIFHSKIFVVNASNVDRPITVLLMISAVQCKGLDLGTLWDSGANVTLITHRAAEKLNLEGIDVFITITKVGNEEQSCASKEYVVPLTDKRGRTWNIRAIGMDEITADINPTSVEEAAGLFRGITPTDIKRPNGKIDLLVASDCCTLLPNKVQQVGNLQLMSNQFGYCLRGSHPLIRASHAGSNHVFIKLHHINANVKQSTMLVEEMKSINENMKEFFAVENMGVCCAPKCGTCECGKLSNEHENLTIAEERELKIIKESLKYDSDSQHWVTNYPWVKDPHDLPNNFNHALGKLKATERRLKSTNQLKAYNNEIEDMIQRQVARKLSAEEMANYHGPVFYLDHHAVYKPDSKSTKIRIVFNPTSSFMGHVLNDYWAKGPDVINSLVGVLLRFRTGLYAYAGDILKMYHAVQTTPLVQHTHRMLWRNGDSNREPDHLALTRVTFGDKPSGAIATVAMRQTAEMSKDTHPRECDIINRDSYVDDIMSSNDDEAEVASITNGIDRVLEKGNFFIKHWVTNANLADVAESKKLNIITSPEEKLLGIWWSLEADHLSLKAKVDFTKFQLKDEPSGEITVSNINKAFPKFLTRRMVLSQVAKLFDPLGFIVPFLLKAKILMRQSFTKDSSSNKWDEHLSPQQYQEWKQFFTEVLGITAVTFMRCLRPEVVIGRPMLIIFSDGSQEAFGACAYIRWETRAGCFMARLILAKNRIAPARVISIPRMELCGAVIAVRLRQTIEKEINLEFSSVVHIIDSTIAYGQIQSESHLYKTFVAHRVAEIQRKSEKGDWWLTASKNNAADITTRPANPADLDSNSVWQNGPDYLQEEFCHWPIHQGTVERDLEDKVVNAVDVNEVNTQINIREVIHIERFNDTNKLLKVTAIVMESAEKKHFSNNALTSAEYIQKAEKCWIKQEQQAITGQWKTDLKTLGPRLNKDGIIVVGSRLNDAAKQWGNSLPMYLPRESKYGRLYCLTTHWEHHGGVDDTIARIR